MTPPAGRAVLVSLNPNATVGGRERFCQRLADLLGRLGYDVSVVGPAPAPRWLAEHGGAALWQAWAVRRAAAAAGDPADLVVTTGPLGWPGSWGSRRVHVYLGNMVRLAALQGGRWHWRLRWAADRGLAEAMSARGATVVADCEQAAEDATRFYRVRVEAVLSLGIDTDLFCPRDRAAARDRLGLRPDARYGLFVGRGEPGKGPAVALEACRRAAFQLLAAGTSPVPGSIALGVLPHEELAWAYNAADAVVLPTRYEGCSHVALESLASGVPIVTTPTGWSRELGRALPQYRPWLVPPHVDAVAGALARVDLDEARAATAAARQYVLRHNTLAAFEQRWTDFLAGLGALPVPR
jgi:glycosyltransferase involved in cell wall biosynthesis